MIDWPRIIINLRGAGDLTLREIAEKSGLSEHKVQRISKGDHYRLDMLEGIGLLDLHYDMVPHLHDGRLLT